MTVIKVPHPPKDAFDLNRPVNALLKMQLEHLLQAELRLPAEYQSHIYVNAIKTEGEAAEYIQSVTEAVHRAHADAAARRARPKVKRREVIEIAAVADERGERGLARKKSRKSTLKKQTKKKAKK